MNGNIIAFNGEHVDPLSHYSLPGNGYRAYSSVLMRFAAPDTWSPFGAGGTNPYTYCDGDPVNRADPTGHFSWQAAIGVGLGIAVIACTIFSGGISIAAAASFGAAVGASSLSTLILGASALIADVLGIASGVMEESHPKASAILGWVSFSLGILVPNFMLAKAANTFLSGASQRLGNILHTGLSGGARQAGKEMAQSFAEERSWDQIRDYIDSVEHFRHHMDKNDIYSEDLFKATFSRMNHFHNAFFPDHWSFESNFREIKTAPYHANDIARYQYEKVSTALGFFGTLPKTITRKIVVNSETLEMTRRKIGNDLFQAFFETPNGKSTRRIMQDFDLHASSVQRENVIGGVSFIIKLY